MVGGQNLNYRLNMVDFETGSVLADEVQNILKELAPDGGEDTWQLRKWQLRPEKEPTAEEQTQRARLGIDESIFGVSMESLVVTSKLLRARSQLLDALVPL